MRRRPGLPILLASLLLGMNSACGKRADPLAPYVKTPLPPSGLEVAQIGDEVEIRIFAPATTTERRPLPVIELEWFQGAPVGDFMKSATSLMREEVAPGELRVKRFPRPLAEVRYAVKAFSGKAASAPTSALAFKPAPVPSPPAGLQVTNTATGVELRWTNPPGAEPWPTPSSSPTPGAVPLSPSPSPIPGAPEINAAPAPVLPATSATPTPSPAPTPTPTPTPSPTPAAPPPPTPPAAVGVPLPVPGLPLPVTGALPAAPPTPSPTPPTGIRIFRTDGPVRLAREPLQASTWLDLAPKAGEKPCYVLRYATSFKPLVESAPTEPVCVEVKDIVPPEPTSRLVADIGNTFVELSWLASPSPDVAFYRVYRAFDTGARAVAIETQGPVLRIRDPNMNRGPRSYDVVAVDQGGNESVPGNVVKLVIP